MNLKDVANWFDKHLKDKRYFHSMGLTDKRAKFYFPNLDKSIHIANDTSYTFTISVLNENDEESYIIKEEPKRTVEGRLLKILKEYIHR